MIRFFAKHPRRHRAGIVGLHGVEAVGAEPSSRDGTEQLGLLVVHHDRGATGADDLRHLVHDRRGRLFEPCGVAQDLADGIQQVDFLVDAGQFLDYAGGFPLRGEERPHDPAELGSQLGRAGLGQVANFDPESGRVGDGGEPDTAGRGGHQSGGEGDGGRKTGIGRCSKLAQRPPVVPP